MCQCHSASCFGCGHAMSRRRFLQTSSAAAATAALGPVAGLAGEAKSEKVRVALVFLSNSAEREIWPYPGYDCAARHQEILKALAEGCPQVEFVPVVVAQPGDVAEGDRPEGHRSTATWSTRSR